MGNVHINAGKYKGRKLTVLEGVRPTGDRTRQVVFNWLMYEIMDARCCDLFAGTGALGLEALSRGAAFVDFVELNPKNAKQLKDTISLWGVENAKVHITDAKKYMDNQNVCDIMFIDAPFAMDITAILDKTHAKTVYIETDKKNPPVIPPQYRVDKQKTLSSVLSTLLRKVE